METATEASVDIQALYFTVHNLWLLMATILVFIMHLGFACLEAGLTRSKNTINILFKNVGIIVMGVLAYAVFGFSAMYPGEAWLVGKHFGFAGWGLSVPSGDAGLVDYADGHYSFLTDYLFQAMFAATCATIVSGAVAERIKINAFFVFSIIFVGIIYPITGSWKWGGGWLDQMGFYDFAGSTLVHALGGWAALAGAMLLGARSGKYGAKGEVYPIRGENMPLATIGTFLLWFGWYGFNGGSVLSADPASLSLVFVNTTLGAVAGVLGAIVVSKVLERTYDLSMALNGALAGLVSITAGADVFSSASAALAGAIGGAIVVLSVIGIDKYLRIDDPVGAISVHLVCGVWGTLAVGFFSMNPSHTFVVQFVGVASYGAVGFITSAIIFTALKAIMGLRVDEAEEVRGLDISEHSLEAYGFLSGNSYEK